MKKKWIVVVNKWTYLFLLGIPVGLIKLFCYDLTLLPNAAAMWTQIFITAMIVVVCVYFFIRFNTYSHWMNPNHPH